MNALQDSKEILALRKALEAGEEAWAEKRKALHKGTARQRIQTLLDAGSFVELGALVSKGDDGAGVVTGYGTVDERPVYVFAQDAAVHGGAMGQAQAKKIVRLIDLAQKTGAPVVAILDSEGARLDEGAQALSAYAEVSARVARMSGVCPILSVVAGECVGAAAAIARLSDICVIVKGVGHLMVYGPQVTGAVFGKELSAETLGGADAVCAQGGAALSADDEPSAMAAVRALIGLLPACNAEDAPLVDSDDMSRAMTACDASDANGLMTSLFDGGAFTELYAAYEPSIRLALGRIGGRTAGAVVCDETASDGKTTVGAIAKAARFVRFLDCYSLPILTFVNTAGVAVPDAASQSAAITAESQLIYAYAEATSPKLSVIAGNAIGQAFVAMGAKACADVSYAWPQAVVSALSPEACVQVVWAEKLRTASAPVETAREELAKAYLAEQAGSLAAAKAGLVDDVIAPADTRALLIAAMEMLAAKRDANPPKKHGNLPL